MLAIAPEIIDGLLQRLSSDDAFRALMEKDPAAAFESAGIDVPARELLVEARLASKGKLAAERSTYNTKIIGEEPAGPFFGLFV